MLMALKLNVGIKEIKNIFKKNTRVHVGTTNNIVMNVSSVFVSNSNGELIYTKSVH